MSKSLKIYRTILILIVLISIPIMPAKACTIFSVELEDGTLLACNNEDWMYSTSNSMQLQKRDSENYGYVCFYNASYVQGGMNEYGLFYDGATCPSSEVPYDANKETLGYDLGEVVLSKCKTVKEVEKFLRDYNIPSGFCDHLLFADAEGNSAVFEWIKGEEHLFWKNEDENSQVVTNFWLEDYSLGGYPCARYDTAVKMLQSESLSLESCVQILEKTAQDWGNGGTLYSNICNLTNKSLYLFYRGDMSQSYHFNLEQQLQSMDEGERKTIDMDELDATGFLKNVEEENTDSSVNEISEEKTEPIVSNYFIPIVIMIAVLLLLVIRLIKSISIKKSR